MLQMGIGSLSPTATSFLAAACIRFAVSAAAAVADVNAVAAGIDAVVAVAAAPGEPATSA